MGVRLVIKHKLLKKHRKTARTVTLTVDGEPIQVDLQKPTLGDKLRVLEQAQKAGEVDEKNEPTSPLNQARLGARIVVALAHAAGAQLFEVADIDDLLDSEAFEALAKDASEVFAGKSLEDATGN